MDGRPKRRASALRRALATAAALVAVIGATAIAGPANADSPDSGSFAAPTADTVASTDDGLLKAASATSTSDLATVKVIRSSDTVYPVKDGYLDSARFEVIATNANGRLVPVSGTAVLTGGGSIVHTWQIDGPTTTIAWDGRVGHAIRTGLFALTVTALSSAGTIRTGQTVIQVSRKHLVRHVYVTHERVDRHTTTGRIPTHLLDAFSKGEVLIRIRTVAVVHGPARVAFTNNGASASIRLRNGTHTTHEILLLPGFAQVTITHDWARGAARLISLTTFWINSDLE